MCGLTLALALHGAGAAWPLLFAAFGKLLVRACQALGLARGASTALVWAYAIAALLVNAALEGSGAIDLCHLGGGPQHSRTWGLGGAAFGACLAAARMLDQQHGIAPPSFSVGLCFRYTAMRFIRCCMVEWGG